ncbi:hypothetical protein [Cohnella cholangitidis]|uniref:Uncharacterized protein n=1 Tax=Cohnella cholangitidis TaxID=2598458 RepID=A0A7G5BSK6_9BACL|nr:hypothetical protein [Cohnella cholangitidis]QMV39940.1 hypothetical protein FPL14_01015 [Cohnella cholangitidis]
MEHRGRRGGRADLEGRGERGHRGESRGEGQGGRHGERHGPIGAQTFRRGRILLFLEQLRVKRATLVRQLQEPEFQAIQQVLCGELKALDQVIEEYILLFDLQENGAESGEGDSAPAGRRGERN